MFHHMKKDACRTDSHGLLRLSHRDRRKAIAMLGNSHLSSEIEGETEWRAQLQVMLILNVKAEMEILGEQSSGVRDWVESKLLKANDIANMDRKRLRHSGTEAILSTGGPQTAANHIESWLEGL